MKSTIKIVHVQWEDALVSISSRTKKELRHIVKRPGPMQDSVGFLVGLTKKKVTLAQTINLDTADELLEIPRSLVRKMTTLNRIKGTFDWIDASKKA